MNTQPGPDGLLEGVVIALEQEVLPFVTSEKAAATVAMMQSVLQGVRQMLPVYEAYLVDEHNAMTATLREASAALAGVSGEEADRVRERAATLGQLADLQAPLDRATLIETHTELGRALEASLRVIRAHLAPRIARDAAVVTVSAGMIGRG